MFTFIGRKVTRHPRIVITLWIICLGVFGGGAASGFGHGGLFDRMEASEFVVPGSESEEVTHLTESSDSSEALLVVVSGLDFSTDSHAIAQFADSHRSILEIGAVESVTDPFNSPSESATAFLATDGSGYTISLSPSAGAAENESIRAAIDAAIDTYGRALVEDFPSARVDEVSSHTIANSILDQVQADLIRGESVGLPVAALLMIIVFGGVIAATMPLIGAISAIGVGMGIIWAATFTTTIDSFILNVISIIGVALSIDYGLLVVSRFREEGSALLRSVTDLDDPSSTESIVIPAVRKAVNTAGRTVTFSAVTIAFSMLGLMFMRIHILKTISLGGITVTLLAVLAAITLVPALLVVLGRKILRTSPLRRIPGLGRLMQMMRDSAAEDGIFSHLARRVQKHPWIVMTTTFLILIVMASPVRTVELRNNFAEYIPSGTALSTAYDELQEKYPALATPSVQVVADTPYANSADVVAQVQDVAGVASVIAQPLSERLTLLNVHVDAADQTGAEVTSVMKEIRAMDSDVTLTVGGGAALQYDMLHAIIDDAPLALLVVVIAVMILLFLMTGSLLVPLKALIINSLSVLAAIGATAFVFRHGWFGVPESPGLVLFTVACMVAFGFGLAMDYEVFLLSRIKEYWDAGYSNDDAVAHGMQRSGRIITSAAAIIIAVFVGFAMGDMIAIKQIGVALAIMVGTDATVTRLLLVPATMTVLGKWNWWAPAPLQAFAARVGLHE